MKTAGRSLIDLPKAHLHAHLIPSARAGTVREFAESSGVDIADIWQYQGLTEFLVNCQRVVELLRTPDDLARVCREFVEDEAAQGVAYSQPMLGVNVNYFARQFQLSVEEIFAIQDEAFRAATRRTGVEIGYMLGIIRHQPAEAAEEIAQFAAAHADRGVAALGIAGDEHQYGLAPFQRACAIAREAGLLIVPHAGEVAGPDKVREALDLLRPHRVAHGVRAMEDPDLARRLASEGIACDVCVTSNVRLGVVPDIASHPLPAMLAAGVPVTLNADDQLLFESPVASEYRIVRDAFSLSDEDLAAIARTSARVSGAPPATVDRIITAIDAWLRSSPP